MNKKAIFMGTFAIIIFIILSYAFYALVVKAPEDKISFIGNSQIQLLKTYQQGEQDLLYLENLIKYKTYETLQDYNENGGLKQECNARWKYNSECEPDFENNFISLFKDKFNNSDYEIKEIKIQDNHLILSFDLNYNKRFNNFEINYELNPEFKQEIAVDFDKLNALKNEIKSCIENKQELATCTGEKTSVEGNTIFFTIENNKKILVLTDKIEFKKTEFKFNIDEKNSGLIIEVF